MIEVAVGASITLNVIVIGILLKQQAAMSKMQAQMEFVLKDYNQRQDARRS